MLLCVLRFHLGFDRIECYSNRKLLSLSCKSELLNVLLLVFSCNARLAKGYTYSLVTLFSLFICADCRIFDNRRTDETAGDRILEMVVPKEASSTLDAAKILESGRRPLESTNVASASSHIASVPRSGHPLSTLWTNYCCF